MQAIPATPQLPAPPAPPILSGAPSATPVILGAPPMTIRPATRQEISALRGRASELSNQLESATGRRNTLAGRLAGADPAARPGLVERINLLDQRILRIEADIAENGRVLASARPELTSSTGGPWMPRGNPRGVVGAGTSLIVLTLVAVTALRLVRRRRSIPDQPLRDPANEQRMERLEQGVEAIALEVERIAEGQRFVTRLMTERREPLGLGVGQPVAEPIPLRQMEEIPNGRMRP